MQKYDDMDKPKPKEKTKTQTKTGGPSVEDVQDMELKILQGNNLAEKSDRAEDDDWFNEVLEKHTTNDSSGNKILKFDDAKEAAEEVYEKKIESDPFKAQEKMAELFPKLWKEHAINGALTIDVTEGYTLLQDVARE